MMGRLDNWGGAGRGHADQTLLNNPNARNPSDQPATIGNMPPNIDPQDAKMMKYMKDDRFFPYFGFANKMTAPMNTYGQMDEENYVLPDAYTGSNTYLRNIIITEVNKKQTWGTTVALPMKKLEGSTDIQWDEWIFNDTMMTRTPEEAVSRLLSSHFRSFKTSTVRYGIALIMEHGFWQTEKGQKHYTLQLVQIRNAICETAQYGATLALLNPPSYIDDNEKYITRGHEARSRNEVDNWFRNEVDRFAMLNKAEDGFRILIDQLDDALMTRNGNTGDMIIVPSQAMRYVAKQDWFFLTGNRKSFNKDELTLGDNRMVVESRMHKMGEHQASQDPTYRTAVIGSFIQMLAHHVKSVKPEEFNTGMLDTVIYSEAKDDWYLLSYALLVRTLGLFSGWETATHVGDMPITDILGKKVFEGIATWGQVYQEAGQLEKFIKQLQAKDEMTYADFLQKFVLNSDNREKRPVDSGKSRGSFYDQYPERKDENEDMPDAEEEQPATEALPDFGEDEQSPVFELLQVREKGIRETQHGHLARTQVLFNWLQYLDKKAVQNGVGFPTNLHDQAIKGVKRAAEEARRTGSEFGAAVIYEAAWKFAQDLLIAYSLEASARKNERGATPFEEYVLTKSAQHSFSGLSDADHAKLTKLSQESFVWRPVRDALLSEVELVAPEPSAADGNTAVKPLQYPTEAFTLASSFLVLFNIPPEGVEQMLEPRKADGLVPNIDIEWNKNASNQQQLIKRAGFLQISILISAFFSSLVTLSKKVFKSDAEEKAHFTVVANEWVKLANPVNMMTKSSDTFEDIIRESKFLNALDYQDPIDFVTVPLRDTLLELFTQRAQNKIVIPAVVDTIKGLLVKVVAMKGNYHIFNAGAKPVGRGGQAITGDGLFVMPGVDDPILHALSNDEQFMSTFKHRKGTSTPQQTRQRMDALKPALKKLKELLTKQHTAAGVGLLPKDHTDASTHWKPTYLKLMGEIPSDSFARIYLPVNERYINYADDKDITAEVADFGKVLTTELADKGENSEFVAFLLDNMYLSPDNDASKLSVASTLSRANAELATLMEDVTPTMVAMEWTRIWATRLKSTNERMAAQAKNANEKEVSERVRNFIYASLLMSRFELRRVRTAASKILKKFPVSNRNSKYPSLLLNDKNGAVRPSGGEPAVAEFNAGHGEVKMRMDTDVLRNFLLTELSIEDGYFWQWCIENNMIQAIGMLGFKPHMQYDAGTLVMLSAWGKTGNTFYGNANMMLSDNAATKMHYGHFTYYSKSVVLDSRQIIHGRNCVVRDYLGGNGHKVWDASKPEDLQDYASGELTNDIFMVPVLMNHEVDTNHMDITGSYNPDIGAGADAQKATAYSSAAVYAEYWGWRNNLHNLLDHNYNTFCAPRNNTVTFQAHQGLYNHATGKMDTYILDKGHWGNRIYPGCGKVRRGLETYLKPVKWDGTNTIGFTM